MIGIKRATDEDKIHCGQESEMQWETFFKSVLNMNKHFPNEVVIDVFKGKQLFL